MSLQVKQFYVFGPFCLDGTRRVLLHNGKVIPLTNKAFETLLILVRNSGQLVKKEDLMREIWPDTFVEEGSLTRNISVLRKILGEGPSDHQYIQTIPKQGYRFVAEVREIFDKDSPLIDEQDQNEEEINQPTNAKVASHQESLQITSLTNNAYSVAEATNKQDVSLEQIIAPNPSTAITGNRDKQFTVSRYIFLSIIVVVLMAIVFVIQHYLWRDISINPIQKMKVTKFTSSGKVINAVISPDEKYIAYVEDTGQQSLWIRQVNTNSSLQIISPANVSYQGLAFSPDSNYIYYNIWDKKHVGVIHRISVLGGSASKIIEDVMPTLAISPDGRAIAFVRGYAKERAQTLIVANIDGTQERTLARREHSSGSFWQPAWSPDGKLIACATGGGEQGLNYTQIIVVSLESGSERLLTTEKWLGIKGLAWHSDGRGLVITAKDQLESHFQLWFLSYPDGEIRQISNDVNDYSGVSMTADSSALVSVQEDRVFNIWLASSDNINDARKITSSKYEGFGLSWTPDGRIVYVSMESQDYDIWIMDKDGSNKKQLTTSLGDEILPCVSADGKYLLYTSLQTGIPHIWRIDIDGKNPQQLTDGMGEWWPNCSPTDQTFVYLTTHEIEVWRMSIKGGEPIKLTEFHSYAPTISPDGKQLAFSYWDETATPQKLRGAIIPIDDSQKDRKIFDIPLTAVRSSSTVFFRWTPDSQALAYYDNNNGISNIWRLPLDGDAPKPLTDFRENQIFNFEWSRDGKHLACTRGIATSDVVLIKDFH
ncbi:MAG: winged helix-turn-helix domain-containing protein [Acidobacteriota bacterium]